MKTRPLTLIGQFLLLCGAVAGVANAQQFVPDKDTPGAIRVFDNAPARSSLPCDLRLHKKPRLDFAFRYTSGFSIDCRLELIEPGARFSALLRITPQDGHPVLMIQKFELPTLSPEKLSRFQTDVSKIDVSMSGGFVVGPGNYLVEVVVTDQHGRTCRKQQKLRAGREKTASSSRTPLSPGAVGRLVEARWNGETTSRGLRVTVLLHAYSPRRASFDAWDRAFLLESLAALLNNLPCQSVKLIAFNLDRQEEVFRDDSLDPDGFTRLEEALEEMEFVTIPYKSLTRDAWAKFLVEMAQGEISSKEAADAVIFLGPWGSHAWDKLPKNIVARVERSNTHLFYLKYVGRLEPQYRADGLEQLTKNLRGSTFEVRSPEGLAQAINRMLAEMNAGPGN